LQHTYTYENNQQLAQNGRAPGKIYVTGHRVGKVGPYHTALEYHDGTLPQWISAGPQGKSVEGFERLVGGVGTERNLVRISDAPKRNRTLGIVTPPKGMTTNGYFNVLIEAAGNYTNSVDYDLFPGISNSYNSNSYVSGLLNATGAERVNLLRQDCLELRYISLYHGLERWKIDLSYD